MSQPAAKVESLEPMGQSAYVRPLRMKYTLAADGKTRTWDAVRCHDSVAIVLYNSDRDRLIFVKQLRPAVLLASSTVEQDGPSLRIKQNPTVSGLTLELCAGIVDKDGLSLEQIAREEILEETGYDVPLESVQFVTSFRSGVGVTGSLQCLYFCTVRDSQRVSVGGGVHDEFIEVVELNREEAQKLLWTRDEDCTESRPASMLFALSWFIYEFWPKNSSSFGGTFHSSL